MSFYCLRWFRGRNNTTVCFLSSFFFHGAHPVFNSTLFSCILCVNVYHFYPLREWKISSFAFSWQTSVTHLQGKWKQQVKWLVNNVRFVCETLLFFCLRVWQWTPVHYSLDLFAPVTFNDTLRKLAFKRTIQSCCCVTFDVLSLRYPTLCRTECSVASALKYLKHFFSLDFDAG